jgi:probable O-glycosylation ligase (exosortase A-associated)
MRTFVLFAIILGSLPFCLTRPWIGVLVFSWISYMNPHRFTWGVAYDFPFAKIIAVVTILGLFFTRDRIPLPKARETILIILLGLYFTMTNFFAFNPELAWYQWDKVIKILVMTLVTMMLINNPRKLKYLVMVIAFSIGILGIKGGVFSLVTGGENRVFGPPGSFMGDNNDMALALNMILPMLFYLAKEEENKKLKWVLWFTFGMSIISVIFTYSRGGFLTLAGVMTLLLFKSRYKTLGVVLASVALIIGLSYIPGKWFERIESIQTYEEDSSAMGRINAWKTAWNLAKDRPFTGGGFETFTWQVFDRYSPNPDNVHDIHSVYFEILGEHGFIAFSLFMGLILSTYSTAHKLKKIDKEHMHDMKWVESYSDMFQISLLAYMMGGIFLGRAYFDLFYHVVAMIVISKVLVMRALEEQPAVINP